MFQGQKKTFAVLFSTERLLFCVFLDVLPRSHGRVAPPRESESPGAVHDPTRAVICGSRATGQHSRENNTCSPSLYVRLLWSVFPSQLFILRLTTATFDLQLTRGWQVNRSGQEVAGGGECPVPRCAGRTTGRNVGLLPHLTEEL